MDKVFLSVPTRGQIQWQTVTRLEEIRDSRPNVLPILYEPNNLSVALARNRIVKKFMASQCDVLVMVDDDVVPPPHFLEAVLPWLPEYSMVGVPYPLWQQGPGLYLSAFVHGDNGLQIAELSEGINEVAAVGTGCVAISRQCLECWGDTPVFRIQNDPDAAVTSDDFLFCQDLALFGKRVGCWWDGWYADHIRAVGLAPIMETILREQPMRSES